MTDKTFWKWVRRYATAVKELSWRGGYAGVERKDHVQYWESEKRNARKHIQQALDDLVS